MARTIVDIALIELASAAGTKRLQTVKSFNIQAADKKKAVATMNPQRRAIGFTRGVPQFSADLVHAIEFGTTPEVDYHALMLSAEVFQIFYEENSNGRRWDVIDCIVDEISKPFDENGEVMETVKISFLDHAPEA